jgi:acyl-CoA thioesterase-1
MRVLLIVAFSLFWPAVAAAAEVPRILILGDSISAAHGVASEDGWVGRLRERLEREGYRYEVINASVGGDTTSGGLARLPQSLDRHAPSIVIIELGGNDGLRGLPPDAMEANLREMIRRARESGAEPLLLGIRLPPNYGPAYVDRFTAVYRDVAEQSDVPLVPRVLERVGERREWMQPDGIHPNAGGHGRILENVWPTLEPMLNDEAAAMSSPGGKEPRMDTNG